MKKIITLAFLILILVFVIYLAQGVKIDNFNSPYFAVKELYLKLDNKLILRAKNLQIYKISSNSSSFVEFTKILKAMRWISLFFKEIHLDSIEYDNTTTALVLNEGIFTIDSPYIAFNASFEDAKAQIEHLELKDFHLNFMGNLEVDFKKNRTSINGSFTSFELSGDIKAGIYGHFLNFDLSNVKAQKIDNFMDNLAKAINLNKEVKKWIHEYITAQDYEISQFFGSINLKNNEILSLNASGLAKNLNIKFHKNLDSVFVQSAQISLKNETLSFKLNNPSYKNKSLTGSKVAITNIISANNTHLLLDLYSNELNLNEVKPILKAYNIDLSTISSQTMLQTRLNLDILLLKPKENFKKCTNFPCVVSANGNFKANNTADISFANSPFIAQNLDLDLQDKILTFKNANLTNDFLSVDFNGSLDFDKSFGNLDANIKNLQLATLLNIKNFVTKAQISIKNSFNLKIDDLAFNGNFGATNTFEISNIKKILPFSSLLKDDLKINSGNAFISSADFKNFNITAQANFDFGLQDKDKNPYNSDKFTFVGNLEEYKVTSQSSHLSVQASKNQNLQINLNELTIPINSKDDSVLNNKLALDINGKNCNILLLDFNRSFTFETFSAKLGENIEIQVKNGADREIKIYKNAKKVRIQGHNISENFINTLIAKDIFKGGKFDLALSGSDFSNFIARINVDETYVKQYKGQQNLLSFFDTIPSLISFKVPDFTSEGFHAQKATLLFERDEDLLDIKALEINGQNADIYGAGKINLADNDIKMQLEIAILKSYSSIMSKIPIINHILLGKDEKISTIVDVFGKLDDPQYKTYIAKDIFSTPFNIIKNTLTLPFAIFEN